MKIKDLPIFQYKNLDYHNRVAVIFMSSGLIMASIASFTNIIFGISFLINLPNLILMIISIILILFFPTQIEKIAVAIMYFIAFLYLPFNFFTGGGYVGSLPIYFVMIMVYFGMYLKTNKAAIIISIVLGIYFSTLIIYSYMNPSLVIPYEDEMSVMIDNIIGMVMVAINIILIGRVTVNRYIHERDYNASLVSELEEKNKQLQEMATTDLLTGLYNRGYFIDVLQKQLDLMKDSNNQIAVMMIDVDKFKDINDTWGHLYGDLILKKISKAILESVREQDVVARYAGDEFIIMIYHLDDETTQNVAERVHQSVVSLSHRENHKTTLSIGVAKVKKNESLENLLKRADENMYHAKKKGRNKVVYK